MKRWIYRIIIILSTSILIVSVFYFIFRNPLLVKTAAEQTNRFNKSHTAKIYYDKVCFKGFATIQIDSLLVIPDSTDTLLFVSSLSARINLIQLIGGHKRFRKLEIEHGIISIKQHKINRYYQAFSSKGGVHFSDTTEINLYKRADQLLRRIFTIIPSRLYAKDFSFNYLQDTTITEANINVLSLKNGKLFSTIKVSENHLTQILILEGKIKPGQRVVELSFRPRQEGSMLNSPIAGLFGAVVRYKSFTVNFQEKKKNNILKLEGTCALDQFEVDHKSVSSKCISFPACSMKFNLSVGTNYLELDSISEITFGKLKLHPYLKYCLSPSDTVAFSCNIPSFTADDFFSSIPADLFSELKYFEAEGSLSYRAKLIVNLNHPDSLILESKLNSENFKIKSFNKELYRMNGSFTHTAYEKGKPIRSFIVGPENPNFLPLEQIPVVLQNSILLAEDCSFYGHKGFLINGIRRAIAENIKEGKFARGGSTISQQLIKNVYLSREKTITRKLEEVILVWLIESNRLVPKSRMFEVYLNIIEWGPNVYGVKEASRFYFQKDASQLNSEECIFLASVIPRPKKFYYRFDRQGKLAPFMVQYYKDMSGKLQLKGLLPSANGDSLSALLKITGQAKSYLRMDTISSDTIRSSEFLQEEIFN